MVLGPHFLDPLTATDLSDDGTGLPNGGDPDSDIADAANDTGTDNDSALASFPTIPLVFKALAAAPTQSPNMATFFALPDTKNPYPKSPTYYFTVPYLLNSEDLRMGRPQIIFS